MDIAVDGLGFGLGMSATVPKRPPKKTKCVQNYSWEHANPSSVGNNINRASRGECHRTEKPSEDGACACTHETRTQGTAGKGEVWLAMARLQPFFN